MLVAALIIISVGGGAVTLWYATNINSLVLNLVDKNVSAFNTAKELKTTLVSQRGFVTYYFLDGDTHWLDQMELHNRNFRTWLKKAEENDRTPGAKELLLQIDRAYDNYSRERENVISLYKSGKREEGQALHWKVRNNFLNIYNLCDEYKKMHEERIKLAEEASRFRAKRVKQVAVAGMTVAVTLSVLLVILLFSQVLNPIQRLAEKVEPEAKGRITNEVRSLSKKMHGLMDDVDQTRTQLEKSRELLMHSEKMAVVGKLAAEVAHSIRNPMTSIKMRLFSLRRSVELNRNQVEDFDVISEEMRRLDNILSNFLEFSRPPKLKVQKVSVSETVSLALQLLEKRLEHYGVEVERHIKPTPPVQADPGLLKEVLLNLIVNACDAMRENGGRIVITEEELIADSIGQAVVIRMRDNGPGIPESIRDKVMEPFFTTKEDGTGLGLSIASRIIAEHGGTLDLSGEESGGAGFVIALPVREEREG